MKSTELVHATCGRFILKCVFGFLSVGFTTVLAVTVLLFCANDHANGFDDKPKNIPTEAPAAFDTMTNGLFDMAQFEEDLDEFEEVEKLEDGLGPVYNGTSCAGCHQNPVTGSTSQISVVRAGHREPSSNDPNPKKVEFKEPPGGSLIQQRAINPAIQVHVRSQDTIHSLRMSTNILGNGFVEVIPDEDIVKLKKAQPAGMRGLTVVNPVVISAKKGAAGEPTTFEFGERIGRFGWKCQDSSLLNFAAGAYLNEMGITSPLQPQENTSGGESVAMYDTVKDPEDATIDEKDYSEHPFGVDVEHFTRFMRSTKAPPREASLVGTHDVVRGEELFKNNKLLGCAICHHPDFTTPPAGTPILTYGKKAGSDMKTVPEALGDKIIHPYSDFMLHDIGTGDGIVQTQHAQRPPRGAEKREKISDEIADREGIVRVEASPEKGNQRVLSAVSVSKDVPGLDQRTANKIRTAPLWGLRVRPQLMHDGLSLTLDDAIRRHKGQAEGVELKYEALSDEQKRQLIAFLKSL